MIHSQDWPAGRRFATCNADLTRAREEVARLANETKAREADLTGARKEIARLANEATTRGADLAHARDEIARRDAGIADRDFYIERLKQSLLAVERSLSWKITRPARLVARGAAEVLKK